MICEHVALGGRAWLLPGGSEGKQSGARDGQVSPRKGALKPAARWELTGLSRVLGAADQDTQRLLHVLKYLLK